jgi:hypothetical protein
MSHSVNEPITQNTYSVIPAALFMWRGSGIVLIGECENERWVLARGWLHGDRLEYIRRWSFAEPIRFSGQVRRLIMDACGDTAQARSEGLRALDWAESIS